MRIRLIPGPFSCVAIVTSASSRFSLPGRYSSDPADIAFIHFSSAQPANRAPALPWRCAGQAVQHCPGRLMSAEAKDPLQSQRAGADLLRRHPRQGLKPQLKRNMRAFKNGSCRQGNLMPAVTTPQQYHAPMNSSHSRNVDNEGPPAAQHSQVFAAIVITAKARIEFRQVARPVSHTLAYYERYDVESSGCPVRTKLNAIQAGFSCLNSVYAIITPILLSGCGPQRNNTEYIQH